MSGHWRRPPGSAAIALLCVVALAVAVKCFYSGAEVGQLDLVLRPSVALVEFSTQTRWPFEAGVGYVNQHYRTAVVASCAGLNFTVAALLALGLCVLPQVVDRRAALRGFGVVVSLSYVATVFVNALRIVLDVALRHELHFVWDSPATTHRMLGVAVYFSSLCVLCLGAERLAAGEGR